MKWDVSSEITTLSGAGGVLCDVAVDEDATHHGVEEDRLKEGVSVQPIQSSCASAQCIMSAGCVGCRRRIGARMHPRLGIVIVIAIVVIVPVGPAKVGLGNDVVDAGVHKCIGAGHGR